jgi:hypothetical protein
MANTTKAKYAVLTTATGSFTLGNTRVPAQQAVAVPEEFVRGIDLDIHPIRMFDEVGPANVLIAEIRRKAEGKSKQ